jgi:hypothetical protein
MGTQGNKLDGLFRALCAIGARDHSVIAFFAANLDGFVKSPSVRLRRVALLPSSLRRTCKYTSSGFARLVRLRRRAFYIAIQILTFYEAINLAIQVNDEEILFNRAGIISFEIALQRLSEGDGIFNDPIDFSLDHFFDGAVYPQGFDESVAEKDVH